MEISYVSNYNNNKNNDDDKEDNTLNTVALIDYLISQISLIWLWRATLKGNLHFNKKITLNHRK